MSNAGEKISFSVVGCGSIGKRHIAVIDAEPRAILDSVCDVDYGRASDLAGLYSKSIKVYQDYTDMLKNMSASVVNICTPHHLHAEMAIRAAEHGKHILVEKPMALSIQDAKNMIRAAEANNVLLMVVKQNRYNIPIRLTKEALDSGKLGKVFMVDCKVLWNRHDEYYTDSPWRGDISTEGGALFTQASHFIDLLNWWFGDIVSAKASIDTKNHSIEIEDCGSAIIHFESGVLGSILWTTCVYNKNYEGSITIIGEKGTIKIGGQYLNKIEYWDVQSFPLQEGIEYIDKPNAYGKYQGTSSNHDKVIADVVEKFINGSAPIVEGTEGMMSINVIEQIYRNAR